MSLMPLPAQPADVPWPTEAWPQGDLPASLDRASFDQLLAQAFASEDVGATHALALFQGGKLIFERYGEGFGPEATYPSWSKAKSITQALVGLLVGDSKLDVNAPVAAPEWRAEGDPRAAITLDQLLRMSSGLKFIEDYVPGHTSDVIEMLGASRGDVAGYAANQPLEHAPGSFWSYASGTTNIIARLAGQAAGGDLKSFMWERLFGPLGMKSPIQSSMRPAPSSARPTASPPPRTSRALGCFTCAAASGKAASCCRPAGSTTPARPPSNNPA